MIMVQTYVKATDRDEPQNGVYMATWSGWTYSFDAMSQAGDFRHYQAAAPAGVRGTKSLRIQIKDGVLSEYEGD